MKITIKILAEDIRTSDYTLPKDCAIYRALSREIDTEEIIVGTRAIHYFSPSKSIDEKVAFEKVAFPIDLNDKVRDMYLKELEPQDFEYELDIPDHWIK